MYSSDKSIQSVKADAPSVPFFGQLRMQLCFKCGEVIVTAVCYLPEYVHECLSEEDM